MEWVPSVACREGLYLMGRTECMELAKAIKCPTQPGMSLLELILCIIMFVLKCNKTEALAYAHKRIARLKHSAKFSQELLRCEEAMNLLDRDEFQDMKKRQGKAVDNLDDLTDFKKDYHTHKSRCRGAAAAAGHGVPETKYPDRIPLEFAQATVKRYIPVGTSCWRGNVRNEWWGHCPPYDRIHRRLVDFGGDERLAIISLREELRREHLEKHSLPKNKCPISGIFPEKDA